MTALVLMDFAVTVAVSEAPSCFYHFCECQEVQPGLTEEDIVKRPRREEMDELRRC